MNDPLEVLSRDLSTGRIHKRYRVGDHLLTYEACNLDDAGDYELVDDNAIADVPHDALCKRCFPETA